MLHQSEEANMQWPAQVTQVSANSLTYPMVATLNAFVAHAWPNMEPDVAPVRWLLADTSCIFIAANGSMPP